MAAEPANEDPAQGTAPSVGVQSLPDARRQNLVRLRTPRRDGECPTDVLHLDGTECADKAHQAILLDGLDMIEVDGRFVFQAFVDADVHFAGSPAAARGHGRTITVCRSEMTSGRLRTRTGRRWSGALDR